MRGLPQFNHCAKVWKKDPRPQFTGDFDMWGQLDGVRNNAGKNERLAKLADVDGGFPYYCGGERNVCMPCFDVLCDYSYMRARLVITTTMGTATCCKCLRRASSATCNVLCVCVPLQKQ
jgi:hypothetical protein